MKDNKDKDKSKRSKFYWGAGILIFALIATCFIVYAPWGTWFPPETVTPTTANSSITMTDWTSREDLGELCSVTVYGDKGQITDIGERYDITYYETVSIDVMPDDFDKDLSEYTYIMIRVNPNEATEGYWSTYDYWYQNSEVNYVYNMFACHEAEDLYGNALNVIGGGVFDLTTAGNYSIPAWYPSVDDSELHRGTHFRVEDALADLSATTLARLQNQKFYRSMPTIYEDTVDTADHTKSGDYEWITETFAIKFTANASINATDGDSGQVNITATECEYDYLMESDATHIYFITTETWDITDANFEALFDISFGKYAGLSAIDLGRIVIPDRIFGGAGVTFTSYETILP